MAIGRKVNIVFITLCEPMLLIMLYLAVSYFVYTVIINYTDVNQVDAMGWHLLGYASAWLALGTLALPLAIYSTIYTRRHVTKGKGRTFTLITLYSTLVLAAIPWLMIAFAFIKSYIF